MADRPNVLLFMTDDQGWDDLSLHGNPWLRTPRLDRLGRESVRFSNFIVAPVCAASRAALLTGRHFLRTGVAHVHGGKDFVHRDERLISDAFAHAGYTTALWGKWHCGKTTGYLPWERGFDEAYMADLYVHRDGGGCFNGQYRDHPGWATDTLADYACQFLRRQRGAARPFLAHVSFLTPHAPLVADESITDRYVTLGLSRALATLYAMVEQTDTAVGRVLDELQASGLADRTIVLFMSDNGPACNEGPFSDADRAMRDVNGYKGWKGNMWESGIRSPLFVRWPGRFEPAVVDRLCDICDIFPTLADLCGVDLSAQPRRLDGRSIAPYLRGDTASLPAKESYLWVSPGWPPDPHRGYSINGVCREYDPVAPEGKAGLDPAAEVAGYRGEQWKYMQHPGRVPHQPEPVDDQVLIRIDADPREDRNVLAEHREIAAELRRRTHDWFEQIKAEPHAFHMPEFAVGRSDRHTFVAAYAPVRITGGLTNAGHGLRGFRTTDDGADYHLLVERTGDYRVSVHFTRATPAPITLDLSCDGRRITGPLGADGEQTLGVLHLEEGARTLHLSVADAAESEGPILDRIMMFRFEPVDERPA